MQVREQVEQLIRLLISSATGQISNEMLCLTCGCGTVIRRSV
jgi:hypothetical protein